MGHDKFTADEAAAALGCTPAVVAATIRGFKDRPVPADLLAEAGLVLTGDGKGTYTETPAEPPAPKRTPKPRARARAAKTS